MPIPVHPRFRTDPIHLLRRTRSLPFVAILAIACGSGGLTAPTDPRPGAAAFDEFWTRFDVGYSYFDYKRIDWNAGRDGLRDRAAAAANVSDSALVETLRAATAPLRDVHVWFRRPSGSTLASFTSPRERNWDRTLWLSYVPQLGWQQGVTNWGYGRVGDVGYLTIGAWNRDQVKIEQVDAALEALRDTRALVLDVRSNGGGNDALALEVAARFAAARTLIARVRYRDGPKHTDFGAWQDRTMSPRGGWQYTRPVYLLVGAACYSSNETFISAMRELPNVTVLGDTTGGSSGNPVEHALVVGGRNTGWKYSIPRWIEATPDGRVIEWNGIAPDIHVPWDSAALRDGRDPVLEAAFARAGAPLRKP